MQGRDQLAVIEERIAAAQNGIGSANRSLEEASRRLAEVRNRTAGEFRRLAAFRLDELTAGRVIARLDETDRAILKLLERRSAELGRIESEIEQVAARQSSLTAGREQAVRRRDELVTHIDAQAADIKEQLAGQEGYRAQEQLAREAAAKAGRAESKAARAEADREAKGKPYRDDALFIYLWNRRFLTPDYAGRGMTRALDGWVAKLVKYADSRSNYFMLTELPLRLREHAERQKAVAARESENLREMEDRALQVDTMRQKKEALQAAQKEIEGIEMHMEEAEKRHEALLEKKSAYAGAEDELSRQAIELQVSEIRNDTLENLYREAQATGQPDDDVIVSRIGELKREEQSLSEEIGNLQSEVRRQQSRFQEMEELRRRFRRSHYDSDHSYFPGGDSALKELLDLLMSGRTSGGDVWGRIDRDQQFRLPRQGPASRGGDIFPGSRGGRMGGGGFRTGGGF